MKGYILYYLICAILIFYGLFFADYDRLFLGLEDSEQYPYQYTFLTGRVGR